MHRVLRRQLRRALQLASNEAVDRVIDQLRAANTSDASPESDQTLGAGLVRLVDAVSDSYKQLERDLDLRTRSLNISSAELFELNQRLTVEAETQERARSSSDLRLQLALDASKFSLWDWEFGANSMYFDARFAGFLGELAVEGQHEFSELAARTEPHDAARLYDAIRSVVLGASSHFDVELRIRHRQGHWVWLQTFGSVTKRAANGHALRLTGTVADVSARKSLEQTLADNLRLLETVLEAIPLPVVIRDSELRVRRANAALERMFAIDRAEVLGQRLGNIYGPQMSVRELDDSDHQIMGSGQPVHYESQIFSRDGAVYDTIVAKAPVHRADGGVDGIVSVVTDITQHKRAAAELERGRQAAEAATQAKSRFLANMSHELRTPLNGVVGMASLLEATQLNSRQQHYVQTLRKSAEALIAIINDILDISKIEAGKLDLVMSSLNLRDEIEQVVSLFGARASAKGIELGAHIAPGTPATVSGDPLRLRQVLSNLVSNAIKFTERGEVLVSAKMVRDAQGFLWLRYEVSDTGIGIDTEKQAGVFDAFVQVDDSSTRRFGGTGLGLTICRELVTLMGGSLGVASELRRGSRFYFHLPISDAASAEIAGGATVHDSNRQPLIVSANKLFRAALSECLGILGREPWFADDLDGALRLVENFRQDCSVLEIVFDVQPGCLPSNEALTSLRLAAGARFSRITLLAHSADTRGAEPAVDRVLHKPLCTAAILEVGFSAPTGAAAAQQAKGLSADVKVLLVEDNAINREMASAMLDSIGVQHLSASNGQECLDLLRANTDIKLILMDCQMPVMDGFVAARAIRQGQVAADIPIVALTGNAMRGDREACLAAGMNDHLPKPFDLGALRTVLLRWLAPPEARSIQTG